MRRVDISVNIDFKCGIHGNQTEPVGNLDGIGNFLRAENDMLFIKINIFKEFNLRFRGRGKCRAGCYGCFPAFYEVKHRVLNHFGVAGQVLEFRITQSVEYGIRN